MNRNIFSYSSISKLISSSNKIERKKYNMNLIKSQGNLKEKPPQYSLNQVDFNTTTRIARLEFIKSQEYRTIKKYITQNYERYPIYSDWKIKTKTIKKTIKLTNLELENLNNNEDELIRWFAKEIIIKINNNELCPSWFIQTILKNELNKNLDKLEKDLNIFKEKELNKITIEKDKINKAKILINLNEITILKLEKNKNKKINTVNKINKAKTNFFKSLFSLGIYNYLISNKRKIRIILKIKNLNNAINLYKDEINKEAENIKSYEKQIDISKNKISKVQNNYNLEKNNYIIKYKSDINNIKPLINSIEENKDFMMLKLFSGLEYNKIIGCYIIHNKEKDKYYVGQSKDIMRRIKQHFNGTVPKNPVFAEDYYTSKYIDRSELFEIKIIPCKTKDGLDKLEKQLIYDYDSWNNGYNETSGNI